jgi:hypothetical protein
MAHANGTPIEPGIVQRVAQGLSYMLSGKTPMDWMGPGQPIAPQAQEVKGRTWDFPVATNVTIRPKPDGVSFAELRALADGYDLLRLVIETRKDQVAKMNFKIVNKDGEEDTRCEEVKKFLAFPDQEHDWDTWLRALLEDMFVCDAATIMPTKTLGGKLYSLDLMDGATVKRVLDGRGKTPVAPDPAYQQILKGIPAVDFTREELYYMPRVVRTNKIYGFSPVEQVIMSVNIALRRQLHQLQYYTEGNVPEALIGVPTEWNPDQIASFQAYWDALMEGDTGSRRHARFVPGGMSMLPTRESVLKDPYDEWLARIIAFAFSISPQALVAQMNRATAETANAQALSEGLMPVMTWIRTVMNRCIKKGFGYDDLEFTWEQEVDIDPKVQADIHVAYVQAGIMKKNECREQLGMEQIDGLDDEPEPVVAVMPNGAPVPEAKPIPGDKAKPEDDAKKFDVHVHLPENLVKVEMPEIMVDVPSPIVHIHNAAPKE